jgi:hypothetical protein
MSKAAASLLVKRNKMYIGATNESNDRENA